MQLLLSKLNSKVNPKSNNHESSKNKTKTKFYVVIGTRAQLVKMAPLMALMQKECLDYEFIYTAQHRETINQTLQNFKVKQPDRTIYLKSEANTLTKFLGWGCAMFLKAFNPKKVFPEKGIVLTHGDTVTTAWSAIVAKLAGCKVAYVEAGLRTHRILHPFPEELMRVITSYFSDFYFCQDKFAMKNLKKFKGEKINIGANTVYDSVVHALNSDAEVEIPNEPYVMVSIHRFQTIYTRKLENIVIPLLEQVAQKGFTLLFVLHPSTREVLKRNNMKLYKRLQNNKKIILKERYPYFEFLKLLNKSEFVITDGGSNQEEVSYLGIPTLLFKTETSRIEGMGENAIMSYFDPEITMKFAENYKKYQKPFKSFAISPCKVIVNYLKNL